jgi:hypothetical protein
MLRRHSLSFALAGALLLAGCAAQHAPEARAEAAPEAHACPAELPSGTRCLAGRDTAGAFYLVALPAHWNGTLVLHAHGGPTLGAPTLERTEEDLQRWAIVVRAGYAWAGSSFRQGGVAVHSAAEDTERLRRIFVEKVARPKMTILHGQSWGASVAATAASLYGNDKPRPYDAVLLTSGVLAGGSRAYDFRLDLRVIYQALCANHPRADEQAYPLWMGLPPGAKLTSGELHRRVDACLGLDRPAAQRTAQQQEKVDAIVHTLHIPASSIQGHMAWATFHFRDIAQRMGERSVFGNKGVRYQGSRDDDALNAAVARYARDPAAWSAFAHDTDPDGRIPVPVLTVHGMDDPTAFVEMDDTFLHTMRAAGTADHLVQTFTDHHTHSYLADPVYPTLLSALSAWAQGGPKPTPAQIALQCQAMESRFGPGCGFQPDYRPRPLATRVTPRD